MKQIAFALLFLAASTLPACHTNEAGESVPSWPAIHQEIEFLIGDLNDARPLFENPDTQAMLVKASESLVQINLAIDGFIQGGDTSAKLTLIKAISAGVKIADGLLAEDLPDEAKAVIFVLKASLRRWEAYAAQEPTADPPAG